MTTKTIDVIAIGNAIVDIIGRCDDAFLARHGAAKGSMQLVDADRVDALYKDMGPGTEVSGGSAANTMVGIASLGGRSAFIGKVSNDEFGRIFAHDIKAAGVAFSTPASTSGAPTARSLILVTPDGERTMNTFLGVSPELASSEVDAGQISAAKIVYLEGYLFDRPEAKAAFRTAAAHALKSGAKVALTLSDAFCVDRHRAEFLTFIRDHVHILFANEAEVCALYEKNSFDEAAKLAAQDAAIAVITRSAKGAVVHQDGQSVTVQADPIETVVDTTGAGDLYAAGFLFGHARGLDNMTSGHLGALAAAEIISHVGPRPLTSLKNLAIKRGLIS
jgi:sugar/nucleoside kinase (ribokinase family)